MIHGQRRSSYLRRRASPISRRGANTSARSRANRLRQGREFEYLQLPRRRRHQLLQLRLSLAVVTNSTSSLNTLSNRSCRNLPLLCNDVIDHRPDRTSPKNPISPWQITSSPRTTITSAMSKVEQQLLSSYTNAPTPRATKRNRRFWILVVLAGMLLFTANFRSALKVTSWGPRMGCGKGRFYANPTSHYTLPSGDKIPSVALGESVP